MPPSGYTKEQVYLIIQFLKSCSISLKKECAKYGLNPLEALQKESLKIQLLLNNNEEDKLSKSILMITQSFYQKLIETRPKNFDDFNKDIEFELKDILKNLLSIKVQELGKKEIDLK